MTLDRFDRTLKTLAGLCTMLAAGSFPGIFSPTVGIILALTGVVLGFLAGSPLFDPTLVGKTPLFSRVCTSLAGLSGAVAGASFFPQVQHLFSADHGQKLGVGVAMLGAVFSYLAQSPIIAGGTAGAGGGAATLGLLVVFVSFSAGGCAHMTPVDTTHIQRVEDIALDCTKDATRKTAIMLLDDVSSALLGVKATGSTCPAGDWVCALTLLGTRWGDEAVDCAVTEVFGQAQGNAMASKDETETTKAARAQVWLEKRGRAAAAERRAN